MEKARVKPYRGPERGALAEKATHEDETVKSLGVASATQINTYVRSARNVNTNRRHSRLVTFKTQ